MFSFLKKIKLFKKRSVGRYLFKEALIKKKGLIHKSEKIETLAIGSSHCALGFNTCVFSNSYNLGNTNQDLFTSYAIFEKVLPHLPNLKNLILFYSVFSPGHELEKTSALKQQAINKYIFKVPYQNKELNNWKRAVKKGYKKFKDTDINYQTFFGYWPLEEDRIIPFQEERAQKHLRENKRNCKQNKWVKEIINLSKKHNLSLTVVIPPARNDYNLVINKTDEELFSPLFRLLKENRIPLLNLRQSELFKNEDFIDGDHLSQKGADKLTLLIKKSIHHEAC